jgi:hypothetical protein
VTDCSGCAERLCSTLFRALELVEQMIFITSTAMMMMHQNKKKMKWKALPGKAYLYLADESLGSHLLCGTVLKSLSQILMARFWVLPLKMGQSAW